MEAGVLVERDDFGRVRSADDVAAFPAVVAAEVPCESCAAQGAGRGGLVGFPVGCDGRAGGLGVEGEGEVEGEGAWVVEAGGEGGGEGCVGPVGRWTVKGDGWEREGGGGAW